MFAILASWKDFLWPLLVLTNPDGRPLSVRLPEIQAQTPLGVFMAALFIASLVPIVGFLIFQRSFLRGGGLGGAIKGSTLPYGRFPTFTVTRRGPDWSRTSMTSESPGLLARSALVMASAERRGLPPIATTTSPSCRPALAAGLPLKTATAAAPRVSGGTPICTAAEAPSMESNVTPIQARLSAGLVRISSITERAPSIAIAKPMFWAPFAPTVLMPISFPFASTSAPPEFPD